MKRNRIRGKIIAGIAAIFILAGASGLLAQDAPAKPDVRSGFYLSVQTAFFSGMTFPSSYFTYQSIGGANVPSSMYLGTTASLSTRPGLGLALGYEFRIKGLRMGAEIEYAMAAASNGAELLTDDIYYGATYSLVRTERSFTQSGRKLSVFDLSLFMGIFPFRSFDLGFNVAVGGGYGRQSFTSPSVADAAGRNLDIYNLRSIAWFDFGDYDGGGTWSRGSFIYFVGLGAEFNFSRRLSLRFDYKYVASSYTRENVLISSGFVNVYQKTKDFEYTVGNKFTVGLNFRI